ncbi:MAG: amidohydrolase family protein [Peptoniphilaceae bacterium]|nr:amidohydrolase family protein [Peptoniphilaceae bacterium]MDD7383596.1 amidohydrolase family protein [Peptoniphilaceae bacterium]MDY3738768.1 amidohydrolase family protein [Peptoniphilaceae bacterium]
MTKKIITSNNVLVGENLELKKDIGLVIENDKIIDIIENFNSDNTNYEVLNYNEKIIMPGMIDCHNHLALDARLENHLEKMNDPEVEHSIRAIKTMKDDLESGVTASRCMGDKYYIDIAFKSAQNEGRVIGPRLTVCGIGMRSLHGHGYVGMPFVGEQEFRKQSRENIRRGADFLKLFTTGVINKDDNIPAYLTLKEMQAVVEEANSVNIPTAIHVSGGIALDRSIDAGITTLEHVYYINDEQIQRVKDTKTWVVFTPSYGLNDDILLKFSPKNYEESMQEKEKIKKCLSKAIKAGINFGIGTDGLHAGLSKEAKYIHELGAENIDVLKGITVNAAKILRRDDLGSIDINKKADFVVLDKNPLDNIDALKYVYQVIQGGMEILNKNN